MQGWPPDGGAVAGYGSMYQHACAGGQMLPVQGYGHAGYQAADQAQGWQAQNCARTQGSSSQGPPGGGNRYAALAGGDDGHAQEIAPADRGTATRHPRAYDWPDELELAQGQQMPTASSSQQPPAHPVGGGGVPTLTPPVRVGGFAADTRRAEAEAAAAAMPTAPVPPTEGGGEVAMKLIKLSNSKNTFRWSNASIRMSLEATNGILRPDHPAVVVPQEGGFEGPYLVAVTAELADVLIEEGYTELYDIDPDSFQDQTTFDVREVDAHGRDVGVEATARVEMVRAGRRAKKDRDERARTLRFFFNGTPEMLLLAQTAQLEAITQTVAGRIADLCRPYERYNTTQLKDETGRPVPAWIVFVVMEEDTTTEDYARTVRWPELKWIVYDRTRVPVKVRTSGDTLGPMGRKQCCFMLHNQCDASSNGGVCGSRRRAMRMVTLPSTVAHPNHRAETAARKERTSATQAANKSAMAAAMASRTLATCTMFTEGSCLKGYGSNRPCQRKHGANPEAIGCWYNEAFGDTCKATGTCPYNHAFPNAVRIQRREAAAAAAATAAEAVEQAGGGPAPAVEQQAPAIEGAVMEETVDGALTAWQPTTPPPPAGTPSGTPPRGALAGGEERAAASMQVDGQQAAAAPAGEAPTDGHEAPPAPEANA